MKIRALDVALTAFCVLASLNTLARKDAFEATEAALHETLCRTWSIAALVFEAIAARGVTARLGRFTEGEAGARGTKVFIAVKAFIAVAVVVATTSL